MKPKPAIYNPWHFFSALVMILALLWLTISLPFVFSCQQQVAQVKKSTTTNSPVPGNEEETANPLSNTTEEKTPSSPNTLNEYLHQTQELEHPSCLITQHNHSRAFDTYTAFHGELVGPPPKFS